MSATPDDACLDEVDIIQLTSAHRPYSDAIDAHLDACALCRRLVAEAIRQRGVAQQRDPTIELQAGDRVGRYMLLGRLGAGASGVVFRAHDPELDRDVAIKLVPSNPERSHRVLAEARAMARFTHPHVVPVFDAGTCGSGVYVVMQYLRGGTLQLWEASARPSGLILERYLEAGRGLEAAHALGLVHGDFKPANVLLDEHGRAMVADFGLAAHVGDTTERDVDAVDATPLRGGTPLFMSPDSVADRSIDARADQYAYCIALYCALWGRMPFDGDTTDALHRAKRAEAFVEPISGPVALWPVLRRGLQAVATRRHATMTALLRELERVRDRPKRRARALALVTTAVVGLSAGALAMRGSDGADCPSADRELAGVWDESVRAELKEHASTFDAPAVDRTIASAVERIDAYAQAWIAAEDARCESGVSDDAHAICLDLRNDALRGLVDELRVGDRGTIARAVDAAWELPDIAECDRDPTSAWADTTQRQAWATELASIRIAQGLGRRVEARARADALREDVVAAGDAWMEAELHLHACADVFRAARFAQVRKHCEDASSAGIRGNNHRARTQAWLTLLELGALDPSLKPVAEVYDRLAEAAVAQLDDPKLEAQLYANRVEGRGTWLSTEARASLERAIEIDTEVRGADHPVVAQRRLRLAQHLGPVDDVDEGLMLTRDVRQRLHTSSGSEDLIALSYLVEAQLLQVQASTFAEPKSDEFRAGILAAAEAYATAAKRLEDLYGADNPRALALRLRVLLEKGGVAPEIDTTLLSQSEALVAKVRASGDLEAGQLVDLEQGFLGLLDRAGRSHEAAEACFPLLSRAEEAFGQGTHALAAVQNNCGLTFEHAGRLAEALALHEAAYAARLSFGGPEHSGTIHSIIRIGVLRRKLGTLDTQLLDDVARSLAAARKIGLPPGDIESLEDILEAGRIALRSRR